MEGNSILLKVSFFSLVGDSNQSGHLGTVCIVVFESKSFKFSSKIQPQYTRYFKVSMLGLQLRPFVLLISILIPMFRDFACDVIFCLVCVPFCSVEIYHVVLL